MKKNSGFTLIELLVVIAIIAIIAALAAPGLGKWIENTKATADTNTIKQLSLLMRRYLDEHEDDYPTLAGGTSTWPQMLHKIVPDNKVFVSGFDKRAIVDGASAPVSFGLNNNLFDKHDSIINSPSELIMFAPVATGNVNSIKFTGTQAQNVTVTSGGTRGIYRNGTMLNVAYADTHASPITYNDFKDESSTKGKRRWQPDYTDETSK